MPPKKAFLSFLGIGFLLVTLLAFYSFSRKEANLISTRVVEGMKNLIPSETGKQLFSGLERPKGKCKECNTPC